MSVRQPSPAKTKRLNSGVTTASFSPGGYVEFTEAGDRPPIKPGDSNHKKPSNGKFVGKKKPSVQVRRYLKDIEIWLNNCVNFAERLEGKEGAKILQLLSEARERAIRLRG